MATALYLVILSRGKWYVDFEGKAHGPFESREAAALEGRQLAQFTAHMGRASEVLVPDNDGKYWVVWDSRDIAAGVPKPVAPKATKSPVLTPRKDAA
ncbi:MAG TPA: hypothetical protein VG757_14975 [Devosia sp.]|nr:hypothetical protein [Devosia sp.]